MQNRWCENDPCGHSAALVGYLENEVTLPQGDSDLDDSNFLLGFKSYEILGGVFAWGEAAKRNCI